MITISVMIINVKFHFIKYVFVPYSITGLHLGNDSRGGKIMFYEIKGGDGV